MEPESPAEKFDAVAGTKPKKHLSKKARLAIIISASVLGLAAVGVALYFLVFRKTEPVVVLTDRDLLVAHSWEKQDAPTVIWTLRADGTGELTTNKNNYYNINWELSQDDKGYTLAITTDWLYKLEDSFVFTLDREADTFTVKNLADSTESVFVALGTQEKEAAEQAEKLEKTEE